MSVEYIQCEGCLEVSLRYPPEDELDPVACKKCREECCPLCSEYLEYCQECGDEREKE